MLTNRTPRLTIPWRVALGQSPARQPTSTNCSEHEHRTHRSDCSRHDPRTTPTLAQHRRASSSRASHWQSHLNVVQPLQLALDSYPDSRFQSLTYSASTAE